MNVVSRERFTRAAAAYAVTPTHLLATAADFHPTYSIRTSMAVPSMLWLTAPPTQNEFIVYRLYSMPAARKWAWRLVVICTAVSATSGF